MATLTDISENAGIDLTELEQRLNKFIFSNKTEYDDLIEYVFSSKGKRLRPTLVYLSAKNFGKINEHTHNAALIIEILHNATLLHDDVVDESDFRHNKATLNKVANNKTAILIGDYLFAKAIEIAIKNGESVTLEKLLPVITNMGQGELKQMNLTKSFCIDEDIYFEIILKKTASLISACMEVGALSVNADKDAVSALKEIGKKMGYVFQIKDDVLDYIGDNTGKTTCNDIKEKKITLPLICAWKTMNSQDREYLVKLWDSKEIDDESADKICKLVITHCGISESEKIMNKIKSEIIRDTKKLATYKSLKSVEEITNYIINRDR